MFAPHLVAGAVLGHFGTDADPSVSRELCPCTASRTYWTHVEKQLAPFAEMVATIEAVQHAAELRDAVAGWVGSDAVADGSGLGAERRRLASLISDMHHIANAVRAALAMPLQDEVAMGIAREGALQLRILMAYVRTLAISSWVERTGSTGRFLDAAE